MVAIRIKNRWHRARAEQTLSKSATEHARALAFIGWRLSLESARKLHRDGFEYLSDKERVGVICEFLAFIVHLCDRLAFARLDQSQREAFVNQLAWGFADHMQDNLLDLAGPGRYREPFIERLNDRLADYAQLSFVGEAPGYDLYRYFGRCVLEVMGETQTNRWVMDQAMEVEGPEVWEKMRDSFANLWSSTDDPMPPE